MSENKFLLVAWPFGFVVVVVGVVSLRLSADVESPAFTAAEPTPSRLGKYKTAAVSTDDKICSDIGRDVMKDGGNAMDAAIASLFCTGVVHPQSAGIGGGFLMTIYDAKTGKAQCLDARETAPIASTENMFNHANAANASTTGGLAVAVPGALAGYWAAHQAYGKLPWHRLILPSASLAENGLNVNWHLADALVKRKSMIMSEPTLCEFVNETNPSQLKVEGDRYSLPELAKTLKTIALNGVEAFYEGKIGDKFVQDVQWRGGIITKEDLIQYRVKWVDAIQSELNNNLTLYSMPPPGAGSLLAYILNILKNVIHPSTDDGGKHHHDASAIGEPSTARVYHQIIESFKHAFAHRSKLADPYFNPQVNQFVANLTSESFAREARLKIRDETVNDADYYAGGAGVSYTPDDHGTAHLSTLDQDGLAVSVTSSINLLLGAGFISEQTGIIPNGNMDDFSSPNVINHFGVPPSETNFIKPKKRPLSSMSPTIVVNSTTNQVRLVIGAAGGTKITTSMAYVIVRHLWFGENIKEAIDSKRIHHQLFPNRIEREKGFPSDILDDLIGRRGHTMSSYWGRSIVCAISVEPSLAGGGRVIHANSDYRKRGDVAGIDPLS